MIYLEFPEQSVGLTSSPKQCHQSIGSWPFKCKAEGYDALSSYFVNSLQRGTDSVNQGSHSQQNRPLYIHFFDDLLHLLMYAVATLLLTLTSFSSDRSQHQNPTTQSEGSQAGQCQRVEFRRGQSGPLIWEAASPLGVADVLFVRTTTASWARANLQTISWLGLHYSTAGSLRLALSCARFALFAQALTQESRCIIMIRDNCSPSEWNSSRVRQ